MMDFRKEILLGSSVLRKKKKKKGKEALKGDLERKKEKSLCLSPAANLISFCLSCPTVSHYVYTELASCYVSQGVSTYIFDVWNRV